MISYVSTSWAQTSEDAAPPVDDEYTVELLSQKAASFRRVIATLETEIQEAESRLENAYTQLQTVQSEHIQLLKDIEQLRREETDTVQQTAQARTELQKLLAEVEKSQATLAAAQKAESELSDMTASRDEVLEQTKAAQSDLAALTTDRDAVLEQAQAAKAELAALQTSLPQLRQTHDDLTTQIAESEAAQQRADQLRKEAEDARTAAVAEHEATKTNIRSAAAERDAIAASAEVLRTQLNELREEQAETLAALNLLKAELQEAIAPSIAESADDAVGSISSDRRRVPLPPAQIARAIAAAPGLEQAAPQQRSELQNLLANGVCTHEALETVFVTINRQTLVSLIRDLGRC